MSDKTGWEGRNQHFWDSPCVDRTLSRAAAPGQRRNSALKFLDGRTGFSGDFRVAILSCGESLPLKVQFVSMPGGGCEVHIDAEQTAGRAAAEKAQYRLLDKRTPAGGLIFWVADEVKARDDTFVSKMLKAEVKNLPLYWNVVMSYSTDFTVKCVALPAGGYEVHVDHCHPDVTVGEDGKVAIRGDTLERVKKLAQKVEDEKNAKQNKTGCFIATAACGSTTDPSVKILKEYRDRVMCRNHFGIFVISNYYKVAPAIAKCIAQSRAGRWLVRNILVVPLAGLIRRIMNSKTGS